MFGSRLKDAQSSATYVSWAASFTTDIQMAEKQQLSKIQQKYFGIWYETRETAFCIILLHFN